MSRSTTATHENLQERLNELGDFTQKAQPASSRRSNWLRYSAAVGSALAMATGAEAGIIYTAGPVSTTALTHGSAGTAHATVNIGLDGGAFQLFDQVGSPDPLNGGGGDGYGGLRNPTNIKFATSATQNQAVNFAKSAMIGASANFHSHALLGVNATGNNVGNFDTHAFGPFPAVKSGYVGIDYYGWVKLSVNLDGEPDQITAVAWAYDDVAGESILAGAGAPVTGAPEPASAGLALLALGSAGVLAWRRRKNSSQAA